MMTGEVYLSSCCEKQEAETSCEVFFFFIWGIFELFVVLGRSTTKMSVPNRHCGFLWRGSH